MQKIGIISLFLLAIFVLPACISVTSQRGPTKIIDASAEDTVGGTGTSSADIRAMAERIAREIIALDILAAQKLVKISLANIDNRTRFAFDSTILKDRLLVDLVTFSKDSNLRFSEDMSRADYMLETRITSLSKGSGKAVSDYLLYSFKLKDKEQVIVWADSYETKKQGKVGVVYQ